MEPPMPTFLTRAFDIAVTTLIFVAFS